uniref:E3 ubiquitin ligase apc2, putative n=1 Tax=Arundo donax TaxID=35708 RepID=A0A0A9E6J9_ARUDO
MRVTNLAIMTFLKGAIPPRGVLEWTLMVKKQLFQKTTAWLRTLEKLFVILDALVLHQ